MDDYSFITEIDGEVYLEPENYDERYVNLETVFELYTDPEMEAGDVARMVGVDESDVVNAVFYWTEEPSVYEQLAEGANIGPESDIFSDETDNLPGSASEDSLSATQEKDLSRQYVSDPLNPLQAAVNGFLELGERSGAGISEQSIDDTPDEPVFGEDVVEAQVGWERNGSELEIHAGWNGDTGFVSYAVDGEMGQVLEVDRDEMEDMVQEMYRNAVFGSL
ncbi:MAG: hypothetical protein ABEK10_02165 [Candidatus Nanosalina sp.]